MDHPGRPQIHKNQLDKSKQNYSTLVTHDEACCLLYFTKWKSLSLITNVAIKKCTLQIIISKVFEKKRISILYNKILKIFQFTFDL